MSEENEENFQFGKNRLRGIFYASFGFLLLIALLGYRPEQCPWISTRALQSGGFFNPIGATGTYLSFAGLAIFGFAYTLFPLFLLRAGFLNISQKSARMSAGRIYAMILAFITFPIFLTQIQVHIKFIQSAWFGHNFIYGLGGWLGTIFYHYIFAPLLGEIGTFLGIGITLAFSFWAIFTSLPSLSDAIAFRLHRMGSFGDVLLSFRQFLGKFNPLRLFRKKNTAPINVFATDLPPELQGTEETIDPQLSLQLETEERIVDDALTQMKKTPLREKMPDEDLYPSYDAYVFPTTDLLDEPPEVESSEEEHIALGEALKETLSQFGIDVEIGEIQSGPVITRFELLPAPGVRVEKIENLDKNIALTLRAPSVRILAPVPGKNCVGIEIPNPKPKPVPLKGVLESEAWKNQHNEIPIVLGRGVTGDPLIADLARMPHLLIAGSTGSGKTVCINSIIASFIYHASPEDLRLILVDPKIVEMQVFNRLPHMLLPTLTDPKQVPHALRWLIHEMEWRYHLFASVGARNIAGFNAIVTRAREENERAKSIDMELSPEERAAMAKLEDLGKNSAPIPKKKLPYIVCVIDELADLMLVAPDDIENSVTRLAQLARAAGIHLILATQRPSVNVITGVIKANLPSRIAFKVASKIDSRTILDGNGADALIGRGDMLFLPPGASNLLRAQGAWISDDELNRVVDFVAKNGEPHYSKDAMAFLEETQQAAEKNPKRG